MQIQIPLAYPLGTTVYLLQGMRIVTKEVAAVRIPEFTMRNADTTPPTPRYMLKDDGRIYYEQELFGSPDEIVAMIEDQAATFTDDMTEAV